MYEAEDHSKEQKATHLRKARKISLIIDLVVAVLALTLGFTYIYFSARIIRDEFFSNSFH